MILNRKFIVFILATFELALFWAIAYLLRGADKENYATTIFQVSKDPGIRSTFLSIPYADLGLAFGTNFPLLGYFDLTLLPLLGAVLTGKIAWIIYSSFLVLICSYLLINCFKKISTSLLGIFLTVTLLTTLSPVWMDSNLYNDWPATWSASIFALMVWVILFTSLYSGKFSRSDSLLCAFFSVNTFANDPGYFPIFLVGVFSIFLGFNKQEIFRLLGDLKNYVYVNRYLYGLLFLYVLIVISELITLAGEFNPKSRYFSDSTITRDIHNRLFSPDFNYHERGIGPYLLFLAITPLVLLMRLNLSKLSKRYLVLAFLIFIIATIPVSQFIEFFGFNPNFFFFYPTGGFFFRDVSVFLILVLMLIKTNTTVPINFYPALVTKLVLVGLIFFQSSFTMIADAGPRLARESLRPFSNYESNFFIYPNSQNPRSAGIAFTQQAISLARSQIYNEFWMSTDFQKQGQRLLTASTKLQSKDFFVKSLGTFQGSTVGNGIEFWCDRKVIESYWVDIVVTTKAEKRVGKCAESDFLDLGDLRMYRVNSNLFTAHKVLALTPSLRQEDTSFSTPIVVESIGQSLFVRFLRTPDALLRQSTEIDVPIQYSKNLTAHQKGIELEVNRSASGFSRIRLTDLDSALELSYKPNLTQKIRILLSYMFFFLFFARVLQTISNKKLKKRQGNI
jgi:hypothetical protein